MKRTMAFMGLLMAGMLGVPGRTDAATATLRFPTCIVVGQADGGNYYDTTMIRINYYYGDVVGFMKKNVFEADSYGSTPMSVPSGGKYIKINSVVFRMHTGGKYGNPSTTYFTTGLYPTSDWDINTITYATKPNATGPAFLTWTYPNPATTYTDNLTSEALRAYVEQQANSGGLLSFRVEDIDGTDADGQELWYPKYSEVLVSYSYVGGTVTGKIDLGSYPKAKNEVGATVQFFAPGGTVASRTETTWLDANGNFFIDNVIPGTYDIRIQIPGCLTKKVSQDVGANPNLGTITMVKGDVNGDNATNASDVTMLASPWGSLGDVLTIDKRLFFSWDIREQITMDYIVNLLHPGSDGPVANFIPYYNQFASLNLPMAAMLKNTCGPVNGDNATQRATLSNLLDNVSRMNYVLADFETYAGWTRAMVEANITAMVNTVRNHANPNVKNAYVGNYGEFPGTPDNAWIWVAERNRTAASNFYLTSGSNIAQPACYFYETMSYHCNAGEQGTNVAPNPRAALLWAPIERFTTAKTNLPASHLIAPWISGFVFYDDNYPQYHYAFPTATIKSDAQALVKHLRLRGADGLCLLGWFINDYGQHSSSEVYGSSTYTDEGAWRADMQVQWASLDSFFLQSGSLVQLNTTTSKTTGVQWSGALKGNKYQIIISNLSASATTVTFPTGYPGLPATSPSVPAGTHMELSYTKP